MLDSDERMQGIGGSECAAAVGLHPKLSRNELLMRKLGQAPEAEQNWLMWFGKRVEGLVLDALMDGRFVRPAPAVPVKDVLGELPTKQHKQAPWAFATVDGMAILEDESQVLLEVKTSPIKRDEGWGPAGSDEVPAHCVCQVLWNMAVLRSHGRDIREAWVLALFGTREPQRFVVPWDEARASWLFGEAEKFWSEVLKLREERAA